jgi:hypothetical protein
MPQGPAMLSKWYKVTTPDGGSMEVFMSHDTMRWIQENDTVVTLESQIAHEAWRQLWKDPATARVLKKLCGSYGENTDKVKKAFESNIIIEDLR